MDGLAHYVEKILSPALRRYGVSESFVRHTAGIVDLQASSLLRHWNEVNYRKTLLLIGAEEGPFYEPAGKYDVKCFVVVAIRNSPIETIQSKNFKDTGLDHPISDRDIRAITSRAIDYFNAQDFDTLCREVRRSEKPDFYREITNKYPTAWTALRHLAAAPAKVAEYQGVSVNAPYQFEKFKLETFDADRDDCGQVKTSKIILDAYSPKIDLTLMDLLLSLTSKSDERGLFVVDSFKTATRNFEKLLKIMEFLMTRDGAFVTSNFYLENGHVERRSKPLRASHSLAEMKRNLSQTSGLGHKHTAALKLAARHIR